MIMLVSMLLTIS